MESHQKGFLKLKCFSPLKILTSPLFEDTIRAPFFLFFLFLSLSLPLLRLLRTRGVLMILEEKVTSSKTSFEIN
jgi:hypothetical protein